MTLWTPRLQHATRILMSPPAYYQIPVAGNAHMNIDDQPDLDTSWRQWTAIHNIYERLGAHVSILQPLEHLPDMVFTANGLWARRNDKTSALECVLSNYRLFHRKREKDCFKEWALNEGIKVYELPEDFYFEGQGEVVTLSYTHFFGWGIRTSREACDYVTRLLKLQKPVVSLQLIDEKYYHLDTCLMALRGTDAGEAIIYHPEAFAPEDVGVLRKLPSVSKFEVSRDLAEAFACNSVFLGKSVLLNIPFDDYSEEAFIKSARGESITPYNKDRDVRYKALANSDYPKLFRFLWDLGYEIIPVYTSEFRKSGAGVRCVTLLFD